jgi:hypothetical protein
MEYLCHLQTLPGSSLIHSLPPDMWLDWHDGCNEWSRNRLPFRITCLHPRFYCGSRNSIFIWCVYFVDVCLSFCTFSFSHCFVCSSSIYEWCLPRWYLPTLLTNYQCSEFQYIFFKIANTKSYVELVFNCCY